MSTAQTRRNMIVDLVNSVGSMSVVELALHFKVSKVTIRADLDILEAGKKLIRTHGNAQSVNLQPQLDTLQYPHELSFADKQHHNRGMKAKIAKHAVEYINDYETILLDSGTTMFDLAMEISKKQWQRLTIITTSLPIANLLSKQVGIDLVLLGGHYRRKSHSFTGALTEKLLSSLRFSKLFVGADGYHHQHGITTLSEKEASLNRLMLSMASEVFVLCDHTKFGRQSSNWICEFDAPHHVITDDNIRREYITYFKNANVDLVIVKK
ncbi:DeoR/GlpR family DNA-binding transcription regulator [Psittacicella hinzii]|uniref:HTH deoR-type domain-containing protein n=1 Tax=Psittacicella hinzii TaxID=2028575 RepID=A0A3A1YPQ9_9GAMM|nr:DeoR/GlpR family DNA-binding transcription regulator [Psittacicella hinzii]RIY39239.1 hypothetical protein CKF58_02535 [Psittacicella hinzii]